MVRLTKQSATLMVAAAIGVALLLSLGLACGGEAAPTVLIRVPKSQSALPVGDIQVVIEVANFRIVDKMGQANVKGEGHVHYYLDVADLPTAAGKPAFSAEGTYHAVASTSYTISNVGSGGHNITAQLVNNDHTPLEPPVYHRIPLNAVK